MLNLLKQKNGFIEFSKKEVELKEDHILECDSGIKMKVHSRGVLEFYPKNESKKAVILSCGVHGNETAPIEIVSEQISQIIRGDIIPQVNLMYILGNPESMLIEKRFVAVNMNRLFCSRHKDYEITSENKYEIDRARELEFLVNDFYHRYENNRRIHLDLHTAIKPSYHKTFAIRPVSDSRISHQSKLLLQSMGIEAILQHNKKSTTFSAYSSEYFNAEAYTLELGKVKKFGENNPDDFILAHQCLDAIVKDQPCLNNEDQNIIEYKVVAEIIKNCEDFNFYIDDTVENFTAFEKGHLIAEGNDYEYRVNHDSESVVFPNINVPVGQRVAVMVTQESNED